MIPSLKARHGERSHLTAEVVKLKQVDAVQTSSPLCQHWGQDVRLQVCTGVCQRRGGCSGPPGFCSPDLCTQGATLGVPDGFLGLWERWTSGQQFPGDTLSISRKTVGIEICSGLISPLLPPSSFLCTCTCG